MPPLKPLKLTTKELQLQSAEIKSGPFEESQSKLCKIQIMVLAKVDPI